MAAVVQNSSVETENAVKGQGDRQVFLTGWGCHTDISRLAFKETLNIKSGISSKPKETCPNILPTLCVCVYFSILVVCILDSNCCSYIQMLLSTFLPSLNQEEEFCFSLAEPL